MKLQFERVVATGSPALDSGIGDTALKTFNGVTYLYGVTGATGGISVWELTAGGAPVFHDDQYFGSTIALQTGRFGQPVTFGAQDWIVLDIDTATGLVGYQLNGDGTIGALSEAAAVSGGGDVTSLVQYSAGASEFVTVSHQDTAQVTTYRIETNGTLAEVGSVAGRADSMQAAQVGSNSFVVAANAADSTVQVFGVDPMTGSLSLADTGASLATLGIHAPVALEIVQAHGQTWVLVAGSGSNSISVMRLDAGGNLIPTDHALDTLGTRFGSVQDMKVVEAGGHVFVLAGGGDDGVSLLTMTPDGKLVYLDSFADTLASGLQNVEVIEVAHVGNELQIFAGSQLEPGLTQLSVSLQDLGVVVEGYGTVTGTARDDMLSGGVLDTVVQGGAGDDILIAGRGATTLTGGSGSDIFVMRSGSGPTTITDFQAGTDRLDLFDYLLLRNPGQLTVTSTAQGAQIDYRDETVHVVSADGSPLDGAAIFGAGFQGPDHMPVDYSVFAGPQSSGGVAGPVSIDSRTANPGLSDAEIRFTPAGNATITAQADGQGQFDLGLPDGTLNGHLDIIKTYSNATREITALDSLQVLRISVGMDPTWGPASPEDLIAADITGDGKVTAMDALVILQVAVGMPSLHEPEWVFLDQNADLSGITRHNVSYDTGVSVAAVDGVIATDMTSILLGNLEAP